MSMSSPHLRRSSTFFGAGALLTAGLVLVPLGLPANAALGTFGQPGFLGNAESFGVVAGTTVTNVVSGTPIPQTLVDGDLAVSPGTAVTGFPPGLVVNGMIYTSAVPPVADNAQADASAAFGVVDGLTPDFPTPGIGPVQLGGTTPVPGVYQADAFLLDGTITLDGAWDDVWVFQSSSTLTTGVNSTVLLTGDANPCNIFWQLDSGGVIGVGSAFVGTVLALTSIDANTQATVEGRLFAQAAVNLDHNQISTPTCLTGPSTPTTPPGGGGGGGAGADDGNSTLPNTGVDVTRPALVALLVAILGVALVAVSGLRRNRTRSARRD